MASSPSSWPNSAGPGSLRARLYVVRDTGGLDFLADLSACARDGAVLQFEPPATAAGAKPGNLILVIIQDDRIKKIARLSYDVKEMAEELTREVDGDTEASDAEGTHQASEQSTDADYDEEEEDAKEETYEAGGHREHTDDDYEEEEEEEEDDDDDDDGFSLLHDWDGARSDECDDEFEGQPSRYYLKLRLWHSYASLVLFDSGHWKLTRQHTVHWLKDIEMDGIHKTVGSQIEEDEVRTKAFSSWPEDNFTSAFHGFLECAAAESFITSELSPHVHNFKFSKVICVTSDSKVYCCSYVDSATGDLQFVLKKMQITDEFDDKGAIDYQEPREITIFSSLKDRRIVTFFQAWAADGLYKTYLKGSDGEDYDVCEDGPEPRYVIIKMNLCLRSLDTFLSFEKRVIDAEEAWAIFTEIVKAVKYIHQIGVIHRDLKPGNVFFVSPGSYQVKIGDFGHSCWSKNHVNGKKGTPYRGTQLYSAPELDDVTSGHTNKADIYSLGVIFAELFISFTTGQDKYMVLDGLKEGVHPTEWQGDTILLKWLTASSPRDRPSAVEILEYVANRQ